MTGDKGKVIQYVYIAGPYRNGHPIEVVKKVVIAAEAIASLGYFPFLPHSVTRDWAMRFDHPEDAWIGYCMAWVRRCDALVRLPGESEGSDHEMRVADEIGIPVFGDGVVDGLEAFMWAHDGGKMEKVLEDVRG